jgi:alkylhydroperoxidase/carboxymuconolactone decarboxylase family protein YurZ
MPEISDATRDMPILQEALSMTVDSFERSGLDDRTYVMVRIAALAAIGANPGSWLFNLSAAADSGVTLEDVQSVLVAIMPVIGTPRTVAAVGNAMRGIGMAVAGSMMDEDED